jgi:hypothetical protein
MNRRDDRVFGAGAAPLLLASALEVTAGGALQNAP